MFPADILSDLLHMIKFYRSPIFSPHDLLNKPPRELNPLTSLKYTNILWHFPQIGFKNVIDIEVRRHVVCFRCTATICLIEGARKSPFIYLFIYFPLIEFEFLHLKP